MLTRHAERQCENSGWDMFLNELNVIHLIVLAHIFRLKIHLSQYISGFSSCKKVSSFLFTCGGGNRTRQSAERDCLQAEAERAV